MSEQLAIVDVPAAPKLTSRQQLAWDYIRARDGVTADEVGAWLHAHKDRNPHSVDERCEWDARDGRTVLQSKALKPLVTYRRDPCLGRVYIVRDKTHRLRAPAEPLREPSEAELQADPFAGL